MNGIYELDIRILIEKRKDRTANGSDSSVLILASVSRKCYVSAVRKVDLVET